MTEAKTVTKPSLLHAWWVQTVVMLCCFMFCYFGHDKFWKTLACPFNLANPIMVMVSKVWGPGVLGPKLDPINTQIPVLKRLGC